MGKIPVGGTIGKTIEFVFGRYPALLAIFWLPFLIIGAGIYFLFVPFFESAVAIAQHANAHATPRMFSGPFPPDVFRWFYTANLLFLLLVTMIRVGVTKEALGLRKGPRFVYFWFGAAEFRAIGAYLILLTLAYVSALAILAVGGGGGSLIYVAAKAAVDAHVIPPEAMHWFTVAAVVAGVPIGFVWIYLAVRLSYLVMPIVVAEKNIGIIRSWELTKGNVLRIVLISIVLLVVLYIVEILALIAIVGPIAVHAGLSMANWPQAGEARDALVHGNIRLYFGYGAVVFTLIAPVLYGLLLSPSAFAYRALVPVANGHAAEPVSVKTEPLSMKGDLRA